jgi:MFS family permease
MIVAVAKKYFKSGSSTSFVIFATLAAFSTYSCMYAFRKAFAVAQFEDMQVWGISYKILLITSQVIGYTLSKFIGIKVVSELKPEKRSLRILVLIGLSGLSLFFFAIVPAPYNIFFMFLNGLPIGMIFGIVYSYLEGRKVTDILVMGLNLTMIISSGFIKTIGKTVLQNGVHEFWMPFATAAIFCPLLLVSVYMLEKLPPPTQEDILLKTERKTMNRLERKTFVKKFSVGLIIFLLAYTLLTSLRDFRDNFSAEIWKELGYGSSANIFTRTEIPIGICVIFVVAGLKWVKDNFKAFLIIHAVAIGGALMVGISTLLFENGFINPFTWSVAVGMGLYISYVPANSLFFERLIASFHYVSTAGFMVTLADFYGYFGSVGVLFYKNFGSGNISYFNFFKISTYVVSVSLVFLFVFSAVYFNKRHSLEQANT